MRRNSLLTIPVVLSFLSLGGCAATRDSSRARTVPPVGPVSTGSSSATMIPAGTQVVIRTNESISAETAQEAGQYSAEIAQDIVNERGQLLVPKGSPARLTVLEASTGGTVGTSDVELALASITINGRTHTVQTGVVEREGTQGLGANERTAKTVGTGAALGAVIGAIAGGGSGAAAGAAIGAGAAAAGQVLTRGEAVRVPAESVLTFQLSQPMYLRP